MHEKTLRRKGKSVRSGGGWFSLNRLLELYDPGELATAIERHGLQVIDRYGRRALAELEGQGDYSRTKALDLLADRQAEIQNPGPDFPSWDSEQYELEPHPLERFGWPVDALPDFDGTRGSASTQKPILWTERPLDEFERELREAGSLEKAASIHGKSRQRYTEVFKKKGGKLSER